MYIVIVDVVIKKEFAEQYRAAIVAQAEASMLNEEDCQRFEVLQTPGDPCSFTLVEAYTDEAAFSEVHRNTPYYLRYSEKSSPWVESKTARKFERVWPE